MHRVHRTEERGSREAQWRWSMESTQVSSCVEKDLDHEKKSLTSMNRENTTCLHPSSHPNHRQSHTTRSQCLPSYAQGKPKLLPSNSYHPLHRSRLALF